MDDSDIRMQQFNTLRDEIRAIKGRLFWIVALGLFGVPIVTFLAESVESIEFVPPMIPYLVLVLMVMFISEQSALMRAGNYIRCNIEPKMGDGLNWESWLETRGSIRLLDKHFFTVFVLVFFVYYFMSIGFAMDVLLRQASEFATQSETNIKQWWMIAAGATYAVGAIWALSTLVHHWKSATRTSAEG